MAGRTIDLGPTGETVRQNVNALREHHRHLTFAEMSRRLDEIGRPIPPLGIRRIESGDRRVDTDDLVAIALVLGVSPATLLMPRVAKGNSTHDITGATNCNANALWRWITGQFNMKSGKSDPMDIHWIADARPVWATKLSIDDVSEVFDGDH